ncbi:hypothetical protein A2U01_0109613, partial [Trifolium medium]|nr:hypothetical protein [Trifolium medium]
TFLVSPGEMSSPALASYWQTLCSSVTRPRQAELGERV